ncbi:MAG: polymerase sigma-70 factor, subfamily [Actinomycetota bacterium]|jgi:RNA polymerase sigma-70 factor (ECF subfamily)|nr:polymerase sigma-70 factor, subfamily [Actinomycetota bacterium]
MMEPELGPQDQSLQSWPDRELVVAFKGGVPEAYDEMYARYNERVYRVCHRMLDSHDDAREATQETFLKAYLALPRFNGQYRLGAWLARIAANVCLDHIRRRARSAAVTPLTEHHEAAHVEPGPEDLVVRDVPALSMLETIQPLHARALELRNLQGFSHKEIADQLHMSPMQVKALLHRARVSFKRAWDNASGWALAPLVGLRSLLHHSSRDASSISTQLPMWSQAAVPMLAERVAASAMVVAIALSSAGTTPAAPAERSRVAAAPFAEADAAAGIESSSATTATAHAKNQRTLVADVSGLLDEVRTTAEEKTENKKPRPKNDDENHGGVGPTSPDRASQKLVKKVNDTAEDVLPDH